MSDNRRKSKAERQKHIRREVELALLGETKSRWSDESLLKGETGLLVALVMELTWNQAELHYRNRKGERYE